MPAAVIQALMPCLTQIGDGNGADAPALALEVGQHPRSWMVATSSFDRSPRVCQARPFQKK
jgi:hypothetical protein